MASIRIPLLLLLIFSSTFGKESSSSSMSSSKNYEEANDEEAAGLPNEDAAISHLIERKLFSTIDHHHQHHHRNRNQYSELEDSMLFRNCSYTYNDVFCDCDPILRHYHCHNIEKLDDIRRAFDHLLNVTRLIYWSRLEIHCIDPSSSIFNNNNNNNNDDSTESGLRSSSSSATTKSPNKSFHISYEMFTEGPRFETIFFIGDCSKPRHYDNLITVDRDVRQIVMIRNLLRMATSCSLLQPKFERLEELILRDCVVAGDMISSTFSTRCLGQYGTRNEPMQLSKLTISSCNISLIESGAFYNFAELELIDLSQNQISHLSRQAFAPHLYRLRTLKLNHNKLTNLAGEFFEKLPELREVILTGNRFTTLPPLPSAGPGVAQVLHLGDNPWDCRCRLTWLLDEPMDSIRIVSDEPRCLTPLDFQNKTLFKGLIMVKETFC